MIEIRTDENAKPLTTDGPHYAEGTRAIANGIDDAFRLLNYATMSSNGLAYPSDVYSILGTLSTAAAKLPQALAQMTDWMIDEVLQGTARENPDYGSHRGDAQAAADEMAGALQMAADAARNLDLHLGRAQSYIAGMESTHADIED